MACDSDSDNEDGVLEKIASTFDHLFSEDEDEAASDDDEGPPSDSEGIADVDADSGETETADDEGDVFDEGEAAPPLVYDVTSPHRHHSHHQHRAGE